MATETDIDADLTLEIDGSNITPDKFLRCVKAFFGLVSEVTKDRAGNDQHVHWNVQVKEGSNLVGINPTAHSVPPAVLETIYVTVREGIESLENEAVEPEGLREPAWRHVRDLASVVGTGDDDDTRVRVWTKGLPTAISHRAVAHVASLLQEGYEDFGSIDGRVQVISAQGCLHVFIVEPIRNRRVRCFFDESVLPRLLAAFGKRVEVPGKIKYRRNGTPISIFASDLIEFPDTADLPSYREMRGIFRELS
jgi:hypothetical protein